MMSFVVSAATTKTNKQTRPTATPVSGFLSQYQAEVVIMAFRVMGLFGLLDEN